MLVHVVLVQGIVSNNNHFFLNSIPLNFQVLFLQTRQQKILFPFGRQQKNMTGDVMMVGATPNLLVGIFRHPSSPPLFCEKA